MISAPANDIGQTKKPTKTCFSYIRFSSSKQAKGNSEDRQLEIAPRIAREKGWNLDESLSLTDLGLSAYKEANLGPKGKLSGVLSAISSGKIPKGAVMIIEALDRLTRTELDKAYDLFRDLLRAGLELYVDKGNRYYTKESLKNPIDLLIAIVELNAANEFSAKLSDRVGKAWKDKREKLFKEGKRLTKKVPGWIDASTWKLIPERAAIVKQIFKMYDEGEGISSIVKKLNSEQVPTWGGERLNKKGVWNASYISQILHSRAMIGEFQSYITKSAESGRYYKRFRAGDAIENYYPPVISPALFYRVQAKLGNNKKAPRTEGIGNLFSGVAFCKCGAKMNLVNSGKIKYYVCWSKTKGLGCDSPSMRYEPLEESIADFFHSFPQQLTRAESGTGNETEILRGELASVEKQIDNITQALAVKFTEALVYKQSDLEAKKREIQTNLELAQSKAASGKTDAKQVEYIRKHIDALDSNLDLRRRVQDWLLANVTRILCDTAQKRVVMDFKSGDVGMKFWLN